MVILPSGWRRKHRKPARLEVARLKAALSVPTVCAAVIEVTSTRQPMLLPHCTGSARTGGSCTQQ